MQGAIIKISKSFEILIRFYFMHGAIINISKSFQILMPFNFMHGSIIKDTSISKSANEFECQKIFVLLF